MKTFWDTTFALLAGATCWLWVPLAVAYLLFMWLQSEPEDAC